VDYGIGVFVSESLAVNNNAVKYKILIKYGTNVLQLATADPSVSIKIQVENVLFIVSTRVDRLLSLS
jgi:hypothetical protein